jgi:phosphoadenosine phosphosulfate reductase
MSDQNGSAAELSPGEIRQASTALEKVSAPERVQWALDRFKPHVMLSTSFGAQSAVTLHLVTQLWADIPVVLIDTGYLFPETYRFADELTERLKLNLKIYRAPLSPAWQEARFGREWEKGLDGIERYNQRTKVEPMQRALRELKTRAWISGLRRQQAKSREGLDVLVARNGIVKVQPIIDWTDRDVFQYLTRHGLPYHPLWEKGYLSIGDTHTSRPVSADVSEEESRFFGLKRECGLHEMESDEKGEPIVPSAS